MEKNIINIYKYNSSNDKKSFIYSVKNENDLLRYSYFLLTEADNKPSITRLDNAIKFLQVNGLKLQPIQEGDPDYEEFITLFSSLIRLGRPAKPIQARDKSLLHVPKYSIKYPPKKK